MTFSIRYKILLTLFASILIAVAGMSLLVEWSFERGLGKYVDTMEQEIHDNLVQVLAEEYREVGDWSAVADNRRRWRRLHYQSFARGDLPRFAHRYALDPPRSDVTDPGKPVEAAHGEPGRRAVRIFRGPLHEAKSRTVLLDADRNPLVGRFEPGEPLETRPIEVDGRTVGFLGIRPRPPIPDTPERHFSERQTRTLMYIALGMMLAAAVVALPLSQRLVGPVRALSAATRRLAAGEYGTRIPIRGSDEIGELSRDFNSLARTLEDNEKSRRQWIADISHELRTPLSVLRGEIEAIQDDVRPLSPERLQALHDQTTNLARLVNDLYELSLSDIGALSYRKENLELSILLQGILDSYRKEFEDRDIAVTFENRPGVEVFADPDRLRQLFSNLLGNALRYTDPGGRVELRLDCAGGWAVIDVRDSAPGVDPVHLPRLFDRLYRVEDSRNRATGGSGLGLTICRSIADAHEGRIEARPSPLGGLWIRVQLPLREAS